MTSVTTPSSLLLWSPRSASLSAFCTSKRCFQIHPTLKNIQKHLARFVRIKRMNRISIQAVAEHRPETEKWLLAYDCYQIEIIELASIIEVLFRDYFEALLFISCESKKDSFLEKIVRKYTGNDFMNIEKTNDIYKKAFGIEIRKNLNAETWDDLLDIVNLRNMIVHNNGQVDKRFESTSTFRRWKDRVDIPLIKIEDEDIAKLLSSVIDAVTIISNLYLKEYYQRRNRVIANYYFNKENAYDFFCGHGMIKKPEGIIPPVCVLSVVIQLSISTPSAAHTIMYNKLRKLENA